MEDGQDSDGVVSVTDSEDEEQKAKEDIYSNWKPESDRDDAPMHHSWPFTIPSHKVM